VAGPSGLSTDLGECRSVRLEDRSWRPFPEAMTRPYEGTTGLPRRRCYTAAGGYSSLRRDRDEGQVALGGGGARHSGRAPWAAVASVSYPSAGGCAAGGSTGRHQHGARGQRPERRLHRGLARGRRHRSGDQPAGSANGDRSSSTRGSINSAIVDRVTFNAHVLETGTSSYRLATSKTSRRPEPLGHNAW
jgi:hypothetical protein